jgi:ABC-type multidrug transport system fused ATPase/permease subunit
MDEVLRQVGLYDDIAKMPDGLDTVINEDNKKLFPTSFTKLFFIASALLRKSKLMVIDEGTKDLNSKQLKKIINLFKELKSVTTFIFITNQPAVFDIADKILWLDKGRVRKFGSKDEIINEYFEAGV